MNRSRTILRELHELDQAVYVAVAGSLTPSLDAALRKLSNAANYSRISMGISAGLVVFGGPAGAKAAFRGMAAVGVTSAVLNSLVKPVARRTRPDREGALVPEIRHVRMPESHSFPSGHSASAVAFAVAVGRVMPWSVPPLTLLAAAVAYSRVHTGVHYPGDVIIGSLSGTILAEATSAVLDRVSAGR